MSKRGSGFLDAGDTPAFPGVYEAAASVVGGTLEALAAIVAGPARRAFIPIGGLHHATRRCGRFLRLQRLRGPARRAFIPIGGLHHARRDGAAGFCVFNDCGVAIEAARKLHGIRRVAYVDIDAHHGDGVFYAFETDPELKFVDLHEDGRFLYPGTGSRSETGRGAAVGTKLNIPLPPGADDTVFLEAWQEAERYLEAAEPELILLQCGADSLGGDPITHFRLTAEAHAHAARRLALLADRYAGGRVLGMGGGGYNRTNLATAWTRVVEELAA